MVAPGSALEAKKAQEKAYRKKGIIIALFSGFLYGGYSSFMTAGMGVGIWVDYYGQVGVAAGVSAFFMIYTLSAVGAAVNDICSAVWTIIYAAIIGRVGDFIKTLNTKPGRILILAAIIGGPLASTAYVVGLQFAGSISSPIAALNAAIGAIIGRFVYKQKLSGGMIAGIVICFIAAVTIGLYGYGIPEDGLLSVFGTIEGSTVIGIVASFIAAVGWGVEGAVGGYACCMVDTEVAICIRQCTSGLVNGVVFCSILSLMGGDGLTGLSFVGRALVDGPSIWFFFIAGVFASWSFKFWYKGAAMCGAALGMGCNGGYAVWCPLYLMVVCGFCMKWDGYMLAAPGWIGAILMVVGIMTLAIAQDKATRADA